jgi:hypothetical protein
MESWDMALALREKRAVTRDGRQVYFLKVSILDGREVLTGKVAEKKGPPVKNTILKTENMWWFNGGLGAHGGDDLMNYIK